jgi:hypothetical protein
MDTITESSVSLSTLLLLFASLLLLPACDATRTGTPGADDGQDAAVLSEESGGEVPYENIEDLFQDRAPEVQRFEISGGEGGTIRAANGLTLNVPPEAFVDRDGNVVQGQITVQVREALTIENMFNTNLSSTSDSDEPLVTGGMFDVRASQNGQSLRLNESINVEMPANTSTGSFTDEMTVWTDERSSITSRSTWTDTGNPFNFDSGEERGSWITEIASIGWINCDVFRGQTPQFDLEIEVTGFSGDPDNLRVYVASSSPAGMLGARYVSQYDYVRDGLPSGSYTVLAIGVAGNVQYFEKRSITLNGDRSISVDVDPTSKSDVTAALQSL